ncbi:MAG: ADP-ribosylglycohydrolase family protein [Ruminococcaceae bacterium]|nr:ADP-ribosylglycohydrolase family protein [Oscillospiraceae bacterium]
MPLKPQYETMHDWEFYASNLATEYAQSTEEGLKLSAYKDLFAAVSRLPKGEEKKAFGDLLFRAVQNASVRADYPYNEPSDLPAIQALRRPHTYAKKAGAPLADRVHGAWLGRVCGCMLGKTVEGIRTNELIPFLKDTGNFPLHRYILRSDVTEATLQKYSFPFKWQCYVDDGDGAPADDDTNYTVMYQQMVQRYGRDFTPLDVSRTWLWYQPKDAYCTAERVAYRNFVNGYVPPTSAIHQNPYREWIGAQIRGDYFGYINPGNPALAAEMAWRDASVSHVKNGIYGEMFVGAMLAVAAETNDIEDIVCGGMAEIPHTSRLYEALNSVLIDWQNRVTQEDCFARIHAKWDEYTDHGWCHTIPNAMIVAAALLYGEGDFERSVCMAVETGFDTDCNGATVGSVLGMAHGSNSIPAAWSEPLHDTLYTEIFGVQKVKISECATLTLKHITT